MADRVIGLDIGSRGIKAAQARVFPGDRAQVEAMASIPLLNRSVRDGEVIDKDVVTDVLKDLWRDNKFATKDVVIGVNSTKTQTGIGMYEYLTPSQLDEALPSLIRKHKTVTADLGSSLVSHIVLDSFGEGVDRKLETLVVSTPTSSVENLIEVATNAGLNVVGVDLSVLAALRALQVPRHEANYTDVIVNVGHDLLTILFHRNGVPRYLSVVNGNAGRDATNILMGNLNFDTEEEAERAKLNNNGGGEVGEMLSRSASSIIKNIEAATSYYFAEVDSTTAGFSSITLMGGGSLLPNLSDRISESFGNIPVHYGLYDPSYVSKTGTLDTFLEDGRDAITAVGLTTARRA